MASFGPRRQTECGQKPGGFTRLTPEVLDWVKSKTGMYYRGIEDPGEMIIKQQYSLITDHIMSAVLITGGTGGRQSAEIYHSDRDSPCVLPNIADRRFGHTQDGSLMCGGQYTLRSCRMWNPDTGAWDLVTEELIKNWEYHTSWTPADGDVTYLMGGYRSDILQHDNNKVSTSFPLKHNTV